MKTSNYNILRSRNAKEMIDYSIDRKIEGAFRECAYVF